MKSMIVFIGLLFFSSTGLAADAVAGKKTYDTACAMCHGATGKGDGPTAAAFNPKARSFVDAEWQKNTTDQRIQDVISKGGPANGLSPLMPAFGHIKGDDLANLIAYIRSFKPVAKP